MGLDEGREANAEGVKVEKRLVPSLPGCSGGGGVVIILLQPHYQAEQRGERRLPAGRVQLVHMSCCSIGKGQNPPGAARTVCQCHDMRDSFSIAAVTTTTARAMGGECG